MGAGGRGRKGGRGRPTPAGRGSGGKGPAGASGRGGGFASGTPDKAGKGRGRGRGGGGGKSDEKKVDAPVAGGRSEGKEDAPDADAGAGGKATRALVEVLRSFSSPQWWLIGQASGAGQTPRKRMKLEDFQRTCTERHGEMRKVYESTMMQDSEQRWLRKVSSEGTSGDKVASLTMLIQVCPVFSTGYLKALLTMAGKTARSDSMMAVDALRDLFITTLLPDRKLKTFAQMEPVSPKGLSKVAYTELCVVSFFEDYLKTAFAGFVHLLSEAAHSAVGFFKTKAIRTAYELLLAKPEQERALLGLLVNKFGDQAAKVSSNASFHLKKLVEAHPLMKAVVVKEIEAFLMRPNITERSRYCAVLHLSELVLSRKEDSELAAQLVRLFVVRLEEALRGPVAQGRGKGAAAKGKAGRRTWWGTSKKKALKAKRRGLREDDNRLIRTLINGIQRAMPYVDTTAGSPVKEETVNTLFKVCHTVSAFSTRIAILSLLFRYLFERSLGDPPDRFYRLVYEQVAEFDLFQSAHRQQAYLLVQRCVPADPSIGRAVAISRRMLQLGASSAPAVAVAALSVLRGLLVARRAEVRPLLRSLDAELQGLPDIEDDVEEHFVDDDAPGAAFQAKLAGDEKPRYLPTVRDPKFARARCTPLWELHALRSHVHPFVAHGAAKLLDAASYQDVTNNPFETFSQSELLEQFVLSSRASRAGQKSKDAKTPRVPFNSDKFTKRKNVPPHERFIQLYFRDETVRRLQKERDARRGTQEEDVDEEGAEGGGDAGDEDEEDKFFDEYLQGQMPAADEDDDDDDEGPDVDDDSDDVDDDDDEEDDIGEEDDGGSGGGEESDEVEATASRGRKRSAAKAELSKNARLKALKKKHAGSMFASAEDFEALFDEE